MSASPTTAEPASGEWARDARQLRLRGWRRASAIALGSVALIASMHLASERAEAQWVAEGRGFGHGVGMSQYGALGLAQRGRGAAPIVRHYFRGSEIERTGTRGVRVLLASGRSDVAFRGARSACGRSIDPRSTFRLQARSGQVRLARSNGRGVRACGGSALARANGVGVSIDGLGSYRGDLIGHADGGSLMVINRVGVEGYVAGVISREVPASWPASALGAQAIAARSYGLATRGGGPFDLYSDTRSQVYGGRSAETQATNRAVGQTRGLVVTHRGSLATAFFSSTSGGRTENSEFGFEGGSPRPYLKAVKDPFDSVSPYHRWRVTFSHADMSQRLSGLYSGRLRGVQVVRTGRSPRIVTARVVGTRGSSTVSGPALRTRLGLRSTWVRIQRR